MGGIIQTLLAFMIVLSLLVFVHELGHFLFAKRAGILVREFAIGLGPKIFSRRKGETIYSLRLLPLGGYVRMAGDESELVDIKAGSIVYATQNQQGKLDQIYFFEPSHHQQQNWIMGRVTQYDIENKLYIQLANEDDPDNEQRYPIDAEAILHLDKQEQFQIAPENRRFGSKTAGQKALTILAGPLFNLILAVILFAILTGLTGIETRLPIQETVPNSPAEKAGIQQGDLILAVDDKRVHNMDMLRVELADSKGEPIELTVQRGQETFQLPITPAKSGETYIIGGIFDVNEMTRPATIIESIEAGFSQTYQWSIVLLDGFTKLVTGQLSIDKLGGPVQMGDITGQAAKAGLLPLVKWTALLSLNLAIFNLLPIPALDGSRLVFVGIEALRGKPVHPNKENLVHLVGFAMLMMLMLVVTYNDIIRIFFT